MTEPEFRQTLEVAEAAWIANRLSPLSSGLVSSVVPVGFDAYARLLHPLEPPASRQPIRWRDVAAWSGVDLVSGIGFPEIALPEREPSGVEPCPGEVPRVGSLHSPDAEALAKVLARHTTTPERCWFCTWEGWGSVPVDDGPRVELPGRNYAPFVGPLVALSSLIDRQSGHSPNLWWPDDRAWCVATEIDLSWTYVGGSVALINETLTSANFEAQLSMPEDNHHQRPPKWLDPMIEDAASKLLDSGTATLEIWCGTVSAQLERPDARNDGDLHIQRRGVSGFSGSSWSRIFERDPGRLRSHLTTALTRAIIELR